MSDERAILGLNAYHGDSSAALLIDGNLAMAVEEERYNRIKHWAGLPVQAAAACVSYTNVPRVDHIAISRDPRAHFFAKIARALTRPSSWRLAASRASNGITLTQTGSELERAGLPGISKARFHFVEHHRAHMASAFFASPFEEAAVVSVDGFGDFSSVMWGVGRGNRIEVKGGVRFPHSLGLFYTAFTQFLGFPHYGDEYKMMGLSSYGEPRYAEAVRDVIRIDDDQIRLNLDYFRHHNEGVEMTWAGAARSRQRVFRQVRRKVRTSRGSRAPKSRSTTWISRPPRRRCSRKSTSR